MGTLQYASTRLHFDVRMLAHLQIVIVQKLRANEGFLMSWLKTLSAGSGRTSIWIQPGIPLRFDFEGNRTPSINRDWLHTLHQSANSSTGLIVTDESGRPAHCDDRAPSAELKRRSPAR